MLPPTSLIDSQLTDTGPAKRVQVNLRVMWCGRTRMGQEGQKDEEQSGNRGGGRSIELQCWDVIRSDRNMRGLVADVAANQQQLFRQNASAGSDICALTCCWVLIAWFVVSPTNMRLTALGRSLPREMFQIRMLISYQSGNMYHEIPARRRPQTDDRPEPNS